MKKLVIIGALAVAYGAMSLSAHSANCAWTNSCQTNNQSIYQAAACRYLGICKRYW